jgi:quercetin dioxygenase-like cupin family protein
MPVISSKDIKFEPVQGDGIAGVEKANVIGVPEGWEDHTLRVFTIEPGGNTPHHEHDWPHINYVMKGKGRLTIEGRTHEIGEGDFAFVPSNKKHQFQNPYDSRFEFICIVPNRGAY